VVNQLTRLIDEGTVRAHGATQRPKRRYEWLDPPEPGHHHLDAAQRR